MGEHFKTDTGQLAQFLSSLEGAAKDLNDARSALSHVRADQIGTPELDEACDGFQERWKYGSDVISARIDDISEGVKENKKNYEKAEESLEEAFEKMEQATSAGEGKK